MKNTLKVHVMEAWIPEGSNYFTSRISISLWDLGSLSPTFLSSPINGAGGCDDALPPNILPRLHLQEPHLSSRPGPLLSPREESSAGLFFPSQAPLVLLLCKCLCARDVLFQKRLGVLISAPQKHAELWAPAWRPMEASRKKAHMGCVGKMIPRSKVLTKKSILN